MVGIYYILHRYQQPPIPNLKQQLVTTHILFNLVSIRVGKKRKNCAPQQLENKIPNK